MRISPAVSAAFLAAHIPSTQAGPPIPFGPFSPAQTVEGLVARASSSSCPANYYSCENQGSDFAGVCCPLNQVCSVDGNNEPACCPNGAICTGSVSGSAAATTSTTTSYIPDYYYSSFPYIYPNWATASTTLANREACNAALDQCHQQLARCTANLVGGDEGAAMAAASSSDAAAVGGAAAGQGSAAAASTTGSAAASGSARTTAASGATPAGNTASATGGNGGNGGFGVTIVVSGTTTVVGRSVKTEPAKVDGAVGGFVSTTAPGPLAASAGLLPRYWTTLDSSSAASICAALSTQACGGLPTDAAGCASSYTAASTRTTPTTTTAASSGSPPAQPLLERTVVFAVAAGGVLAGMIGMLVF